MNIRTPLKTPSKIGLLTARGRHVLGLVSPCRPAHACIHSLAVLTQRRHLAATSGPGRVMSTHCAAAIVFQRILMGKGLRHPPAAFARAGRCGSCRHARQLQLVASGHVLSGSEPFHICLAQLCPSRLLAVAGPLWITVVPSCRYTQPPTALERLSITLPIL